MVNFSMLNILKRKEFRECFPVCNSYLEGYLDLVFYRSLNKPLNVNYEKFNVIPKFWFKLNGLKIDNSENNVILVTLKEEA